MRISVRDIIFIGLIVSLIIGVVAQITLLTYAAAAGMLGIAVQATVQTLQIMKRRRKRNSPDE